jgi:hypothetical protein
MVRLGSRVHGAYNISRMAGTCVRTLLGHQNRMTYKSVSLSVARHFVMCSLLVLIATACYAGDVVLLRDAQASSFEENQIREIAEFLGLGVRTVNLNSKDAGRQALSRIKDPATLAVVLSEGALARLDWARTVASLRERKSGPIPILLFGINGRTDQNELKLWSGGAVGGCTPLGANFHPESLRVSMLASVTRQLAGMELPAVTSPICKMETWAARSVQTVLAVRQADGANAPLLVRTVSHSEQVFFVPQLAPLDVSWIGSTARLPEAFSSMAPFMLFLSYAAGDYGWHMDGHYANFTVDDAWLIQPYGYLDYDALLVEMEKHNFHTTIAFIPWNFDRNKSDVVATFQSHRDRYSVCLHGNNHAHREFGEYRTNSLNDQIADIKQGIARMESFSALTQISYDRFMVFPHGVAPEPTFAALRTYGFLGTANASNIPFGAQVPSDSMFPLRSYTTNYASLLSLYRYPVSVEIPKVAIAVQAFLGNPLLFYGHADLFSSGIGAFNAYADFVNHLQPGTRWTSLGEIARHSYLLRKRAKGGTDVRMLSSEMKLENSADTASIFYIRWNQNSGMASTLTADGALVPYAGSPILPFVIPAHESRTLRITYDNDLDLSHEATQKRSLYVYMLRMVSDFRDLYLFRSTWGNALVRSYYQGRWDSAELYLEHIWWVIVICVAAGISAIRFWQAKVSILRQSRRP